VAAIAEPWLTWDLNPRFHAQSLESYNYKTDVLHLSARTSHSLLHEFVHFHDHIATPYGYFLDTISDIQNGSYRALLGHFNNVASPPLPLPLARFLTNDDRLDSFVRRTAGPGFDVEPCADFLIVFAVAWMNIVAMERSMEGLPLPGEIEYDVEHLIGGIRTIEGLTASGGTALPADVFEVQKLPVGSGQWSGPDDAVPRLKFENGDRPLLGATALLESRAYFLERSSADVPDILRDLVRRGHHEYFAPVSRLADQCLALGIKDYRAITDTFYAFADLALSPPLGVHAPLRRSDTWSDVHPGYRFIKLVVALKDLGPFDRTREWNPLDYEDRCAARLGWPAPSALLQRSAQLSSATYRGQRHAAACRLKLKYPRFFINAGLTYLDLPDDEELNAFEFEYMPLLAFAAEDVGGPGPSAGSKQVMERLIGAYLQSLGWSIVMRGNPDEIRHLDPGIRHERYVDTETGESLEAMLDNFVRKNLRFTGVI